LASRASTAPVYATSDIVPRLRRITLSTQGLGTPNTFGKGKSGVLKAIERLGYVQIDTISVVERAHHHVLFSRVPDYQPKHLDALLSTGNIFEYWHHAASFLPIRDYRFAMLRMAQYKQGNERWIRSRDHAEIKRTLERIRAEGPLRSRDFSDQNEKRSGWWDWKPAKKALEQLFMEGELMVVSRDGFEKTYDLTERVLPDSVNTTLPSVSDFAEHLVESTLDSHGCAQSPTFTHLRRGMDLRKAVAKVLAEKCMDRELTSLQTEDGQTWFVRSDLWEARLPTIRRPAVSVLSPFDNAVIHRSRGQRLFNFDYVIECYVPEPRRQYGYFCLPLLLGDSFIGRLDAKAHRREQRLELKHLHLDCKLDQDLVPSLVTGLRTFAAFNGCDAVTLTHITPGGARNTLLRALKELP
jgi:uncharacterized protein